MQGSGVIADMGRGCTHSHRGRVDSSHGSFLIRKCPLGTTTKGSAVEKMKEEAEGGLPSLETQPPLFLTGWSGANVGMTCDSG